MALVDWLTGLRTGRIAGHRLRNRVRIPTAPIAAHVQTLEPRRLLSGTNVAPDLVGLTVELDPMDTMGATTLVSGAFTDDIIDVGYTLEFDFNADQMSGLRPRWNGES